MAILQITKNSITRYKKTGKKQKSFKANIPSSDYLYSKSVLFHKANIYKTNPIAIEKYFDKLGIEATFREGSEYAKKFVSYCCYQAAEIFKQLHHTLPIKIDLTDFRKLNTEATGICNYGTIRQPKFYPIRSVIFNTFEENKPVLINSQRTYLNWENYDVLQKDNFERGFLSVKHFMSPFIHEFAHSLHYHKLFSKFGCPEPQPYYPVNPNANIILQKLNIPLMQNGKLARNPFVSTDIINSLDKEISHYGATLLPETFAEAYTKDVISCMDLFNLRLTQNPFPTKNMTPEVNQVLNEIWEGLVGDGAGLI